MRRPLGLAAGVMLLALLWWGPLAGSAAHGFSAHMTIHIGIVAVAAPLIALGLAGGPLDPVRRWRAIFSAMAASIVELLVVWGWHAPVLHHLARTDGMAFAAEQATFLAAGLWLWLSAFGGGPAHRAESAWKGVAGLLFTSIHMTLLGALFALAPRALYGGSAAGTEAALADLHLGGGIMLVVGGASYLAGGLWLAAEGLRHGVVSRHGA